MARAIQILRTRVQTSLSDRDNRYNLMKDKIEMRATGTVKSNVTRGCQAGLCASTASFPGVRIFSTSSPSRSSRSSSSRTNLSKKTISMHLMTFLTPLEFSTEVEVGWEEMTEDCERLMVVVPIGETQTVNRTWCEWQAKR
jgi:hypothetical protein